MSAGRYNKGHKVLVKLEHPSDSQEPFAVFAPDGYNPGEKEYHALDFSHLRHVNRGKGPLYLDGVVLCKHIVRRAGYPNSRIEYCVHVPPERRCSLLELGHTTKDSLLAPDCPRHLLSDMLCRECIAGDDGDARYFMLGLGYVCTIRVSEQPP